MSLTPVSRLSHYRLDTPAATRLPQVVLLLFRHAHLGFTTIVNQLGLRLPRSLMLLRQES
jgi:hypothetical protein